MPGAHRRSPPPPAEGARTVFTVARDAGERLDRFLADQLGLSRTQTARLIADRMVLLNGGPARASRLAVRGDRIEVSFPIRPPLRTITPAHIPLDVVFEDDQLLVIDKPAGLVVHPAPGHWDDTLVNALAARGTSLSSGFEGRPGIVHRLDRDTSGLMIVAKTDLAHRRLGAALAARRIQRRYAALVWGHLAESPRIIEAPIGRSAGDRKRMTVREGGRAARTDAVVLARFGVVDLLHLALHSGRTHQIRVHLAHIGHPVVGDPVYGGGGSRRISGEGRRIAESIERLASRQALHAALLAFHHPVSGTPMQFLSDWPDDLYPVLTAAAEDPGLVAQPLTLRYLGFLEQHG